MLIDLAALKHDIEYCENTGNMAVAWPVTGRFKNEQGTGTIT